ncbi:hypothetical protein TNCV_332171 [Trichonephila clavipes]|nr:hypothetical protein TNCV_332171 [Trichonephila clavipes]
MIIELNKLQREIKKRAQRHQRACMGPRPRGSKIYNIDTLFKIINRKKQKQIIYPPLLGYRGLVMASKKNNYFHIAPTAVVQSNHRRLQQRKNNRRSLPSTWRRHLTECGTEA